ncbi:MAG: ABC transporter permease subunit [Sinobacteraceae bacterium]|nr:ABC transporter permease subunit [Nevskiaceae bacterium]MCP5340484.1 ABC transporter permease subunit [Nevskiaceae bacterium]MCP5359681.1 ABC transporter permease subunit [Nevskiaceae bacterium]MCP5472525.1 ABC transporter permease subunit [Nevskiaceae bacterium]
MPGQLTPGRLGPLLSLLYRYGPPRWSHYVKTHWSGQRLVMAIPYLWLLLFFAVPFLIVLKISFSEVRLAMPPYAPLWQWAEEAHRLVVSFNFSNYLFLLTDALYVSTFLYSVKVAAIATLFCLLLGYPMAYAIARATPTLRNLYLMLIILPFWTSFLLRVYAWVGLLKADGVINNLLMGTGLLDAPLTLLYTDFAVYIGIVYSYLPFMILPLYANLEKHDPQLLEAAADLGAHPLTSFLRITWPLSRPGVIAGSLLVFIPAVGEFVIPSLLGRSDQLMIGRVLSDEFFANRDWPVASAVAIAMLLLLLVPIVLFQRFQSREIGGRQ